MVEVQIAWDSAATFTDKSAHQGGVTFLAVSHPSVMMST